MEREIRDAAEAEGWISSGLCLMRLAEPTAESIASCAGWVAASLSDAPALPPAGMIADVGLLLAGQPLDFARAVTVDDPALRRVLHAYEDGLLGRLSADPRFDAAADALARLPSTDQPLAVAVLVEHLLQRIGFVERIAINPGVARRQLQRPPGELLAAGLERLRSLGGADEAGVEAFVEGYEQLARRARHCASLLTDKQIFTLENLSVLRSQTQRLAIEQMVDAAEQLERTLPRRLRGSTRRRGRAPTKIADESLYPAGGFSSLSTAGSIENLVSSELVYMDEDKAAGEIDLFDVRYAEGELLFYTRDDSVFVRNERCITFLLHPDLAGARFKDAQLPWQRLVIVFGLLLCAVRRLADWLSDDALLFRVVFLRGETGRDPLASERQLCQLLLREWIDKEMVEVAEAEQLEDALAELEQSARNAETDLVAVGCEDPAAPLLDAKPRAFEWLALDVGEERPRLVDARGAELARDDRELPPWQSWTDAARELLGRLL